MKALLLLLLCVPAFASEWKGNTLILSPEEYELCVKEGGCLIFTQKGLDKVVKKAGEVSYKAGMSASSQAKNSCLRTDFKPRKKIKLLDA